MHFNLWITPTLIALSGSLFCVITQWRRRDWIGLAVFLCLGGYFGLRAWGHHADYQVWTLTGFALAGAVWAVRK